MTGIKPRGNPFSMNRDFTSLNRDMFNMKWKGVF